MKRPNSWLRFFVSVFLLFVPLPVRAEETGYVGAERCRSCHAKAFEIWAKTPHAYAQRPLVGEHKTELRCLFCHSTDAPLYLSAFTIHNVQCEACHGPGGHHVALALRAGEGEKKVAGLEPVNEQKCRTCHTNSRSSTIRPFNYEAALQKIRHW